MKNTDHNNLGHKILILLVIVGLSSCQSGPSPEESPGAQIVPESSKVIAVELPSESDLAQLAAEDPELEPIDECLICHSDQQTLMDTAKPEVVQEVENSGEG